MYKRDIDNLIRSNSLPSSLLLYGESYFSSLYASFIAKKISSADGVLKFYFDEYSFESAKNHISQPSLFGDVNVLFIKSDKKIPKKELDTFVDICFKNSTSFFIYEFCGEDSVAKDLTKSFSKKKSADFVRFFKPNQSEAIQLLSKKAQKIGLDIDSFALNHLFITQHEDISLAVNELEKLLLLDKHITADDIDTHVVGMGEINIDKFIEKLLKKEDIREDLVYLLENGAFDEVRIINIIQNYLVTLMMFRTYITIYGRYDVIDILGFQLPQNLVKSRATQSSKISLQSYQQLLTHLLQAEYKLKTASNLDKNSFLLSTLIKLQTYL